MSDQRAKAQTLLELHHTGRPVLLINAWDVVSARIVEDLGAPAVATTSAGVAWAEGHADGQQISREHMLQRIAKIASAIKVPLSADLEGAYGDTVADAQSTARGAIEAGAVGLNIEDARHDGRTLLETNAHAARVKAMRKTATQLGVPLVINARTDVFLAKIGEDDTWRLAEALRRGNAYLDAGADCVFVPGVSDRATIGALVAGLHGPLNVLATATTPPVSTLAELGVARVSLGSGAMSAILANFSDLVQRMHDDGDFHFLSDRLTHSELNELVRGSNEE